MTLDEGLAAIAKEEAEMPGIMEASTLANDDHFHMLNAFLAKLKQSVPQDGWPALDVRYRQMLLKIGLVFEEFDPSTLDA